MAVSSIRSGRVSRWAALAGVCCGLLFCTTPALAVHLRGQVVRVGYPGTGGLPTPVSGDIYRVGCWTPVLVELTNDDGDQFDGRIEVRQDDCDGDEVLASAEVSVRGQRRFYLYVPGGPTSDTASGYVRGLGYDGPAPFTVRVTDSSKGGRLAKLFNDKDEPVNSLVPPRQVVPAPADAVVVLDISGRPVNQLDRLNADSSRPTSAIIMHVGPTQLPDALAGFEMADVIVWNAPEPSSLAGVQIDALLEWVQRGGKLILGVGKDWSFVASSKFGPFLPARLSGTQSTKDSDVLSSLLDEESARSSKKLPALPYCPMQPGTLASDATAVRPRTPQGDTQIWVARRPCGRGQIVLVPAELQDIFGVLSSKDESLIRDLLPQARRAAEADVAQGRGEYGDIFTRVAAQTAFQTTSGFYFAFAFAFVIAYIVLITAGSWGWLRRKNAVRHAWVLSAFIAAGASALSLGAVQLVRAVGQGVHEMTIVDGRAGSFDAAATSYMGLKTASHSVVDLCVPTKWLQPTEGKEVRASLRPQTPEVRPERQSRFSVPQEYESVAPLGELRSVPIRATLKQFEANWRGELEGRVMMSLRRRTAQDDRLDASSWIDNQLGTDLYSCYVVVRTPTIPLVYSIAKLEKDRRVMWSAIDRVMEDDYKATHKPSVPSKIDELIGDQQAKQPKEWSPPSLRALLGQSMAQLSVMDTRDNGEREREQRLLGLTSPPYVPALLLLTFYGDPTVVGLLRAGDELVRTQGQQLDLTSTWERDTAIFIGFSDDPSPLRLCRRKPGADVNEWKPMKPSQSVVMYRFAAPVQ